MRRVLGTSKRPGLALTMLLGACGLLTVAASAAADESGIEDNPPYIAGGEFSPGSLSYEGGSVQIRAEIFDDRGLYMTYAQIYRPDASSLSADAGDNRGLAGLFALVALPGGGSAEVAMNPTSSSHFEGTYEVPPTAGPSPPNTRSKSSPRTTSDRRAGARRGPSRL